MDPMDWEVACEFLMEIGDFGTYYRFMGHSMAVCWWKDVCDRDDVDWRQHCGKLGEGLHAVAPNHMDKVLGVHSHKVLDLRAYSQTILSDLQYDSSDDLAHFLLIYYA